MSMIMTFAHKGRRRQLRSGNVSSNDGVLHVQQFVVITTGHHPTHAQTGGDGFGKRTAEYYAAVAVPGVDRARAWVLRCQFAIHIVFKNNDVVALGEGEHCPLTRIRHNESERVVAVGNQQHTFDRPLIQRQLQRFNADPGIRIGWDLNHLDP